MCIVACLYFGDWCIFQIASMQKTRFHIHVVGKLRQAATVVQSRAIDWDESTYTEELLQWQPAIRKFTQWTFLWGNQV